MSFKTVRVPSAEQAGDLKEALEDALNSGGFEVIQMHDNLVFMSDSAALGHTGYEIVPIPANMDTVAIDAALNAAAGALIQVHPNFVLFATT